MLRFLDSVRIVLVKMFKPFFLVDPKQQLLLEDGNGEEPTNPDSPHSNLNYSREADSNCEADFALRSIDASTEGSQFSLKDISDEDLRGNNCANRAMKKVRFNGNKEEESDESHNQNGIGGDNGIIDTKEDANQGKENKTLRIQLEKALRSIQLLEFQLNERNSELTSMSENFKQAEEANNQIMDKSLSAKQFELSETNNLLADATSKIEKLTEENQLKNKSIEELHKRLSDAFEAAVSHSNDNAKLTNGNGIAASNDTDLAKKVEKYAAEIAKLEERLTNANEEKEYYKKHHQANSHNHNASNGSQNHVNSFNDEFGRELMLANKRKYQLESRLKQLEHELKEAHSLNQHLDRNLKNTEKLLWLEKERSATLEGELHSIRHDLEEQRRLNDELNSELDRYHQRDEDEVMEDKVVLLPNTTLRKEGGGEQFVREMENLQKDYDAKITDLLDLKGRAEWRLGEVTQSWHDAKWRVGELEAALAHKEYELDQLSNRIKQLESVLATPVTYMSDEITRLKDEIKQLCEEKSKVEWRLGEVTQFWNDAKWRIGEVEGDLCQNHSKLEDAYRRISELEKRSHNVDFERLVQEKNGIEWRLGEVMQALSDSKWRIGELETELRNRDAQTGGFSEASQKINDEVQSLRKSLDEAREQKSKIEWRLGEVTQYWNDTKWRVGELQEHLNHKDNEINLLKNSSDRREDVQKTQIADLSSKLNGSFVLRKQPHANRQKWNTILWENTIGKNVPLRRVWFEVEAKDQAQEVFLIGSFVNWECAVLCEHLADDAKRRGVWVELPPGRYEFRFILGGEWHTAGNYEKTYNEFGKSNNWRNVE